MNGITQNKKTYINVLSALNESTDDYLFLWDFETNHFFYFGDISKKYAIQNKGLPYCTSDEILKIVYPNDRTALTEDLDSVARGEKDIHHMEYRWLDRNGNVVWISCRGKVQRDDDGQPFALVGRVSDTVLLSKVDTLTGLFNKNKLIEDLGDFLSEQNQGYLMILGIDDFKNINIQYGRLYGDQILKQLAKHLEQVTGNTKHIYRLYGDCFVLHIPYAEKQEVLHIYEHLQMQLPDEYTISAGAVGYHKIAAKEKNEIYQYAEEALEKAKKTGKNKISFFSEEDFMKKLSEVKLLTELQDSIKNNFEGFSLVYQPQVNTQDYSVYGAEALLRYQSSVRGRVFPDEFIPILENTALICPVGLWVLETALADCKKWRNTNPSFHISVNVSYIQLKQEDIAERVLDILEKSGLPGEALTLEVTESIQLQDFEYFNKIFQKWKDVGIQISVDDFGTGYSSLAYLKNLQIDEIKIDRCFVTGIQFSSYNYRLISNMLELARSSEISVCCEGVELEAEMKILKDLHANLLQGYLFSKPCERENFQQLYIDNKIPDYYERLNCLKSTFVPEQIVGQKKSCMLQDTQRKGILTQTDLGLWTLLIDFETNTHEMYIDENMCRIIEADMEWTPEQCYAYWYEHITDGYFEYVNQSFSKALKTNAMIQLEYTWHHPTFKDVTIRCHLKRMADIEGKACMIGYYKILNSIQESNLLSETVKTERFEYNQIKQQIYFHTGRRILDGQQIRESNFPESWITSHLVHPEYADTFKEIFTDVHTKKNRNNIKILLKTKNGTYSLFKLSTRHLGTEESDKNTILVLLGSVTENNS